MAGSFGAIEMGKRSLMATSAQIQTSGHNISNADTEGYSRQRVIVKAMDPIYVPDLSRAETAGQIGQGTDVQSIERIRDELLDKRIVAQGSEKSYWETREEYYSMIEGVYNEPNSVSVRTNMDKFWEGWQELAMYPESDSSRQVVVTRGETLASSIQQQYKDLRGISDQIDSDVKSTVKQVNNLTSQIADINAEITKSLAVGDNPNDLLDRRDVLVGKLSELINVTVGNDDSEFMVYSEGQVVVQGSLARNLQLVSQTDNNGYGKIIWQDTKEDATFKGGTLGALLELRDVDMRNQIQNVNTMALNFADLVNDVHRDGIGKNNVSGLDFFVQHDFIENVQGNVDTDGDGTDDKSYIYRFSGTNSLNPQEKIGLSGTMRFNGPEGMIEVAYNATDKVEDVINRINDSNAEVKAFLDRNNNLVLKATASNDMKNPDYVIRHVEDSGMFLTKYTGILAESGEEGAYDFNKAQAVDSLNTQKFSVSPAMNPSEYIAVNDRIRNNVESVASGFANNQGFVDNSDSRAATEIASLRNTKVMIGTEKTFDDYFADTVTEVGLKGEQSLTQLESQEKIMNELKDLRDSVSGVNVDEELADIIKFQHGYNAAAKFISVEDELLDTLIERI